MSTQTPSPAANGVAPHVAQLPLDDAARVLGISRATVRRRLRSGALMGEQVSGPHGPMWVVHVPAQAGVPTPPQAGTHGAAADLAREEHIADLRKRVDDQAREIMELHRLLAQAHQRALAPPPSPAPQTQGAPPARDPAGHPSWWRRLWARGG